MALQPVFGAMSDRIGRRTAMIWFGALATFTVPIMSALHGVTAR
jgi:MFS family permease